ncbi:SAF domain-containing protein [Actinomadura sp. NPDC048394]|uniref:SAF domain-containing protein n=1 Tax=Actinomadura sp. NPDC048394 TaxID=3158223 RepID=UPI0033F11F3A
MAAAVLVLIAVIANVQMVQASGNRVPVVLLAGDVPMGHKLAPADLRVTRVAVDPAVATVPGRQLRAVVGRRTAVGLRKGSLLAAGQLTEQPSPQRGEALVTVPLKSSSTPPGLTSGWKVRVVFTSGNQDQSDAGAPSRQNAGLRDVPAVVDEVNGPDAEGAMTVSLVVADSDSSTVAREAAAGLVVLVVTERPA